VLWLTLPCDSLSAYCGENFDNYHGGAFLEEGRQGRRGAPPHVRATPTVSPTAPDVNMATCARIVGRLLLIPAFTPQPLRVAASNQRCYTSMSLSSCDHESGFIFVVRALWLASRRALRAGRLCRLCIDPQMVHAKWGEVDITTVAIYSCFSRFGSA
jgi:hypothetical protein